MLPDARMMDFFDRHVSQLIVEKYGVDGKRDSGFSGLQLSNKVSPDFEREVNGACLGRDRDDVLPCGERCNGIVR